MDDNFIFQCVKTGAKCLTFDTCIRKYMATNLTPDQTKESKPWHQKYRDYNCEDCHQGRTIFREESGKKEILIDQKHKRHKKVALKNLEEIERSIRDKKKAADAYMAEETIEETPDTTTTVPDNNRQRYLKDKENTMDNSTDDIPTKIELDFSDHQDLLDLIIARAKIEFRTVELQMIYMIDQQIVHEGELEEIEP